MGNGLFLELQQNIFFGASFSSWMTLCNLLTSKEVEKNLATTREGPPLQEISSQTYSYLPPILSKSFGISRWQRPLTNFLNIWPYVLSYILGGCKAYWNLQRRDPWERNRSVPQSMVLCEEPPLRNSRNAKLLDGLCYGYESKKAERFRIFRNPSKHYKNRNQGGHNGGPI